MYMDDDYKVYNTEQKESENVSIKEKITTKKPRPIKMTNETWQRFWWRWRQSGLTQEEFIQQLLETHETHRTSRT